MTADRQSTADLRSHATDLKREIESKHKWEPKWAGVNKELAVRLGPHDKKRPQRLQSQRTARRDRLDNEKLVRRTGRARKQDVLSDNSARDPSTDDASSQRSITPEPTAEVVHAIVKKLAPYAYNEQTEQVHGLDVLTIAVNKAIEKHEHLVLVKLLKDEYEVLDDVTDDEDVKADDDFELI